MLPAGKQAMGSMITDERAGKVGNWMLEAMRIQHGTSYGKVAILLVAAAFAVANTSWWPFAGALLGQVSWQAALASATLSGAQVAGIVGLGGLAAWLVIAGMKTDKAAASDGALIAIRHRSFDSAPAPLMPDALPESYAKRAIIHEEIDQTSFFSAGILTDPSAALRVQAGLAGRLRTQLQAHAGALVAYYGKAHIPLAFAAGYATQADPRVLHLELARQGPRTWLPLQTGNGPDLNVNVEETGAPAAGDAVIRVSVSYPVARADILDRLPTHGQDLHIRIGTPKIDAITHDGQVDDLARRFRSVLDRLQAQSPQPVAIHVFCAAPMSVVFALGRQVSPTIHPPVIIHNYTQASMPRYAWAVQVNGGVEPKLILPPAVTESPRVQSAR
jgi:hypothetical protein